MKSKEKKIWRIADHLTEGTDAIFLPSVGEYPIYDSNAYRFMIDDTHRMAAFREAIEESVHSNSTVVEFGAGSVAPWARYASDLGAQRVIAVEVIPEVRETLKSSLSEDFRYTNIEVLSEAEYKSVEVKADVLVSEIVGAIGSSEGAYRLVSAEMSRLNNDELLVLPQGWSTKISAFSWRRVMRGARPRFAADSAPYLARLQDVIGLENPRLCLVGPSFRLGIMSNAQNIEVASFYGRKSRLNSPRAKLTIDRDGFIDSVLLTVDVEIGRRNVSSRNQTSSWLPVVAPFSESQVKVLRGDRLEVEMLHSYSKNISSPDYEIIWKVHREAEQIASGTITLPWQPIGGPGQNPLHTALLKEG